MTDKPANSQRGLSIFDDRTGATKGPAAGGAADDETRVIPQVAAQSRSGASPQQGSPPAARPVRPNFPVVRRGGYDKAAVDAHLAQQQAGEANANADVQAAMDENARLSARVAELEQLLSEQGNPTYSGLGAHAAAMLRLAEEQATTVKTEAQKAAEDSRARTLHEAQALKADAEKEASDIRSVQLQEIDERRASVLAEAQQERDLARAEAEDILASAKREADQLRLAAEQETNALRTTAKRETEQAQASADREVTEARRILAVEKERLTKEASEHHSTATAETTRLIDEVEARAKAAEERAREAMATATRHREQANTESEKVLTRSRREAEQIVIAARRQAEQIVNNATADAQRRNFSAHTEVETLRKQRDGIVAQLAQLRDLVATFTPGDDEAGRPNAPDAAKGSSAADREDSAAKTEQTDRGGQAKPAGTGTGTGSGPGKPRPNAAGQ
ncbi:MAG: hypothetical protein ABJC24_06035 [Chloroflexota bacterium]